MGGKGAKRRGGEKKHPVNLTGNCSKKKGVGVHSRGNGGNGPWRKSGFPGKHSCILGKGKCSDKKKKKLKPAAARSPRREKKNPITQSGEGGGGAYLNKNLLEKRDDKKPRKRNNGER